MDKVQIKTTRRCVTSRKGKQRSQIVYRLLNSRGVLVAECFSRIQAERVQSALNDRTSATLSQLPTITPHRPLPPTTNIPFSKILQDANLTPEDVKDIITLPAEEQGAAS